IDNPFANSQNNNELDIEQFEKLYIPLSASKNREGKEPFDLLKGIEEWISSEKRLLTLLADGGSGKSTFCRYLTLKLMKELKQKFQSGIDIETNNSSPLMNWIPIYFSLSSIKEPKQFLEEILFHKPFGIQNFS